MINLPKLLFMSMFPFLSLSVNQGITAWAKRQLLSEEKKGKAVTYFELWSHVLLVSALPTNLAFSRLFLRECNY